MRENGTTRKRLGAVLTALGIVVAAVGVLGNPSSADHGDTAHTGDGYVGIEITPANFPPEEYPGVKFNNPTCGDLGYDDEIKVDPWSDAGKDGTHVEDLGDIDDDGDDDTLTITNADDFTFDFAVTDDDDPDLTDPATVSAVVVKPADTGFLYDYLPEGNSDDTGLESPIQQAISHVSFCFGGEARATTTTTAPTTTTTAPTTTTTAPTTTTTAPPTTTTTAPPTTTTAVGPTTTVAPTTTTAAPTTTTTAAPVVLPTIVVQDTTTTTAAPVVLPTEATTTEAPPTTARVLGTQLARTGAGSNTLLVLGGLVLVLGGLALTFGEPQVARRRI